LTVTSAWTIVDGGVTTTSKDSGSKITLRANHPSEAMIVFDNSDNSLNTTFNPEDEIDIKIGSQIMMHGFIYNVEDVLYPGRRKDMNIYVMDWGSYVASKTIFERDYQLTKYAKDMLLDGAAKINALYSGALLTSGVDTTGLSTSNFAVKGRRFQGTYVKDVWYAAADTGGFDYFVDEVKTLQAWPFETNTARRIQKSGTNYKIVDYPPTHNYELLARLDKFNQTWSQDVQNKYRTVKVINGIEDTYPAVVDQGSMASYPQKDFAYPKSAFWTTQQLDSAYDPGPGGVPVRPMFGFNQNEIALGVPSIYLYVGDASTTFRPLFQPRIRTTTGAVQGIDMNITWNAYQTIGFFINLANLTGQTIDTVTITLVDINNLGGFSQNLSSANLTAAKAGWTWIQILLPVINNGSSNGWSLINATSPLEYGYCKFDILHSGSGSGYTVGSHADFANFNFWRIMGNTQSAAGSPPTQKIVVNRNLTDPTMIQNFAIRELLRTNTTKQGPTVTIDGNTDFRMPGYKCDIDFTASLGTGRSATDLRIDEIEHTLEKGFHYTKLTFDSSFYRP